MKKIKPIKINKIWGYELWLHSPLKKAQTICDDGEKITKGPLIKIIKTNQPLSIQVHPDDKLAKELENEANGKSESWYILEANLNTEYIVGIKSFKHNVIKKALKDKTFEKLMIKINVKPGDYINVPAGLVHGIGANTKLFEVQQPSDITYRFFDYYRLENGKPRELHIDKSLASIKDVDYKKKSTNGKFKLMDYEISFSKIKTTLNLDSIVVDLKDEIGYLCSKGEVIDFSHYAIINF